MEDQDSVSEAPCKRLKLCENSSQNAEENKGTQSQENMESIDTANDGEDGKNEPKSSTQTCRKSLLESELPNKSDGNVSKTESSSNDEELIPMHTAEKDVGITEYVSKHEGFKGILKQRYVDFLVNERDTKGNLVQLTNTDIPRENGSNQDQSEDILSEEDLEKVKSVLESKDVTFNAILTPDDDKDHRTKVHQYIKEKFPSLDTETVTVDEHKAVKVYRYHGNPAKKRQSKWPATRGDYCKFVLYKENKDTMEAINLLSKLVHAKPSSFGYAGTKDRRGVTVQEVRAYRVQAQRLKGLNKTLRGITLGNFEYCQDRLTLGQLSGNHFVITLRNVTGSAENIEQAMDSLIDVGFINYYGLQRFGTTAIPTHHTGKALILSQWMTAVNSILSPKYGRTKDFNEALQLWKDTGDAAKALQKLAKQRSIESNLLEGLAKHGNKDLVNALQFIPRNTRLMYVHSYQSYIWNQVVSWRIKEFGLVPVEGDLVFTDGQSATSIDSSEAEILDECLDDTVDTLRTSHHTSVRMLTSEDITSGKYTIHDIIMPLPGYDVTYPGYNSNKIYKELMAKDGIYIDGLRHRVKDYSLSGTYRRVVVKPKNTSWRLIKYDDPTEPLVLTDMDRLNGKTDLPTPADGQNIAWDACGLTLVAYHSVVHGGTYMALNARPRDGLYAWFVCLCAVFSTILMFGCTQGFGLILPALLDEFQEGKAKTAWVGSLAMALTMTLSPLAARLINRFGPRPVGMVGGGIAALGLGLSPFATSLYVLFGTFSLMYGLGTCFAHTATFDIVPKYFKKRLGLAMGALASGGAATGFVMIPITQILISNVGWRNAFYAFAGFVFLGGVCCLTFSPDVEQDDDGITQEQGSVAVLSRTKSLHTNGSFIMVCVYSFVFQLGNTIPLIHLGRYALESGLTYTQTANLYIGFGVTSTVARIASGKICEYRSFHTSYICCSCAGVVAGVSTIVCPFIAGFPALTIYFCINGLADGLHLSSKNVLLMESCSIQERTTAYGYLFFITSLAYSAGPPLGGLIADEVGSYIPVFYTSGSIVLVSGVLILAVRCFRRKHQETKRTEVRVLLEDCVVEEKVTVV